MTITLPDPPLAPLTAVDFQTVYDADHTFAFFEDEDARIFAYGHADPPTFAAQVNEYYEVANGGPLDAGDAGCQPDDVHHTWAVNVTLLADEPQFHFVDVTSATPGAFPITVVSL